MKAKQNNILKSGIFSVIALTFLCSFQSSYSQETITITDPATTQVTIPAGATNIIVEVWGAGGSGGGSKKNAAAGGGGGGAYSKSINGFSPGTYAVQIGQGAPSAAANTDGTAGGNTWFINASTVFSEADHPPVIAMPDPATPCPITTFLRISPMTVLFDTS